MILNECPVCNSHNFHSVLEVKDRLVSSEVFTIVECSDCLLRFTNPRPDSNDLPKYYESEEYISHTNKGNSLINRIYKLARVFTLRSKRKLIEKSASKKTLLDIGCGTGHFINYCTDHNWEVTGVEPDSNARNLASSSGVVVHDHINKIAGQQFDVITLWHVLEHLPDLTATITKIKTLLKENGKLIIAVPNYLSKESSIFEEFWAAYDVPRHLYHFTPKTLSILAEKNGLKIASTHPMWLDSFYISLLSNQHKYNRNKYINSFLIGLLSNTYAIKNNNFSSIVYKIESSVS